LQKIENQYFMKKINLLVLLCCGWVAALTAQSAPQFFQPVAESAVALRGVAPRATMPAAYTIYQLNLPALQAALQTAPWEFTPAARQHTCTLALPMGDGTVEDFAVWQVAMMAPELAAKAPYIHTYGGESLRDPGKTVRFSTTMRGFSAMVMRPDLGVEYVEPYAWGQTEYYLAYDRADLPADQRRAPSCAVQDAVPTPDEYSYPSLVEDRDPVFDPVKLRVFRLAAACTGEFGQDHGGTVESVLSAIVGYTNFVSAIFERDMDMRLQLVGDNHKVIYLDPATDPYTGLEVGNWMSQNQVVVNTKIGSANYDVGHVLARFFQGGAIGVAGGNTCATSKAAGCSAGFQGVYGADFLSTFGHEVGHQTGASHSWNSCPGAEGQRAGTTAFEPGSGSTIMSYSGSCGTDNVQGNSDPYYHAGTIEQVKAFYLIGPGTCGTDIITDNFAPVVTLPYQNDFYIPISTPFVLDGSATDADGDAINYSWEGMSVGPGSPLGQPVGDAAIFRTRPAVNVTHRYFPRLNTVLANGSDITEQLPTYTRDLKFRLTARDNRINGGGVGWADVAFKAFEGAGPFVVQYPNLNTTTWRVGEYVTVTWDVANTDQSPVNCKKVNIRLSTNSGQGYPVTLAANVDNDGSQTVLVPANLGPLARVRIDAVDNVFYDVSNQNFKIVQPTQPALSMGLTLDGAKLCLPNSFSTAVLTAGIGGFSAPLTLDIASGLPAGATASFSSTTVNPGETPTLNIDLNGVTQEGTYVINVRAVAAGSDTILRPVTLQLTSNDFSALTLLSPADGTTGLAQTQTVRWNKVPDADSYEIELSTSPSFADSAIVYSRANWTADSIKISTFLNKGTAYYWRIRPVNECSPHAWTEPAFFSTFVENCQVFSANDLPKNISANSTPTVESKITINAGSTFNSINVKQIRGNHQFFKELETHLISPTGTDVILFQEKCGNYSGSFNFGLNDFSPSNLPCPPPNNGNAYKPANALSPFAGQSSTGVWTLRVKDNTIGSGGQLTAFQMEFCASVALNPPYIVNNQVMSIDPGSNKIITTDLLLVEDANNSHAQLLFTLVTVPQHGELQNNVGSVLQPGAQFTQADLDAGYVRYFSYGGTPDGFRFTVTDGEGGFLATPRFVIQPVVGTEEPGGTGPAFTLLPNPATETVWVALDRPATTNLHVRLFSINGQLLQNAQLPLGADRLALSVNALPKGIYLVRIENATGAGVHKLVVQ